VHFGSDSSANRTRNQSLRANYISVFGESRILRAMKKRVRVLTQVVFLTFLLCGCSDKAQPPSSGAEVTLGADPAATIIEIFGEPDRLARTERLISALRAVPADQTQVFPDAMSGLEFPNRELDRVLVVTAWAKYDAPAATKWAKKRERVEIVRDTMFSETVYAWARKDPESFLADMEMAHYIRPGIRKSIMRPLIRGWFDSGAPRLEPFIHDMTPQSMDRQRALDILIHFKTARDGPAAMIEWATALRGDVRYKSEVNSRVAAELVTIAPQFAVDWCERICSTPVGAGMIHLMAVAWAGKSGEDAMDFVISQPDSIEVQTAARAGFRQFIMKEPDRALAWFDTTTDQQRYGPILQGPIGMYIHKRSMLNQHLVSIEWLKYVDDEEFRKRSLKPILSRWIRIDQSEAEAWMAQSSMSEEEKQELIEARQKVLRNSESKRKVRLQN
jgi:hypothetical protein